MIQNVQSQDWKDIYSIYQDYVQHSTAIFDLNPMEYSLFQKRMENISNKYPFLVAKVEGTIIGYGYVHAAFEKEAYQQCVESTIYFKEGNHHGLAQTLMDQLINQCKEKGFRWMIACITDDNERSISFHAKNGFRKTGALSQCGYKFNQWNGVVWMSKDLTKNENVYVASNATLYGDITLKENANVWFGAVIRADYDCVVVGENSNVQDNCVIHNDPGFPVLIGKDVTIGHGAIIHGAVIEDECLIGMGATLLNGCKIGKHSLIGANALVTENTIIPPNSVAVGAPAKVIKTISDEQIKEIQESAIHYVELAKKGLL